MSVNFGYSLSRNEIKNVQGGASENCYAIPVDGCGSRSFLAFVDDKDNYYCEDSCTKALSCSEAGVYVCAK
ncbi:MAG: hypothetical protein QM528_02155 [Phycisphaerales bacterium]|nr:hypothetical protein [Phycisphaerales bacterium]